ncbi:hypothetical protein HRG_001053 [Hirsutella rhossiliensis]|uniref:Uncharacterized protein n=1 Tax=Hirsutella rhossiliensis TaxID=111463 RepID=A0A9P8N9E0_9HYPO|nr:uncharacterized protein HRG_01053 [Hirsutella rhossiliensis]KAH0968411.1 hypothetical protein HRG_01053 [Hirsutella rhossiliensis]
MPRAAVETSAAVVRRRNGLLFDRATETPSPTPASSSPPPTGASSRPPATGSARMGTDCFTTTTLETTICALTTDRGRVRTGECLPTQVASSECRPNFMCTTDTSNNDVCMPRHDGLDTGGIVLAVIFGALVALAIGVLAFLCCRDRRQQKRFAAKAEAVALARAHTRKQRAQQQDARTPLMRQQEGAPGSPNPFQDSSQP